MFGRRTCKPVVLFTLILSLSPAVYAGIGKIGGVIGKVGSPVVPSNAPKGTAAGANAPKPNDNPPQDEKSPEQERVPLLVITFSQKRVNFERMLNQAILINERNFPGTIYEVVAVIPNTSVSTSQGTRMQDTYSANLNAVIQQMQATGLSADRIRSNTVYKDNVTDEEVSIYSNQQ